MSRKQWEPTAEPFRVCIIRHSNVPGLNGWDSTIKTYATFAEAVDAANAKLSAGTKSVSIDFAKNAATWPKDGRFVRVASRKASKALSFNKKNLRELGLEQPERPGKDQPEYTSCKNCGSVDHTNYNCPCACHGGVK